MVGKEWFKKIMMKILLVNDQFESGGAARVACTMCNEFKGRGYDIRVVTGTQKDAVKYDLDREIPLYYACFESRRRNGLSRFLSLFRTARLIRKHIKSIKPDVIISIQANAYIRTWLANSCLHYPIIVADHTSFARKMDFINTFTRHHLYKYADGISILTHRDERLLGDKYPQKMVIYNPLTWSLIGDVKARNKTILAAGRFDIWKTKGFDILLSIWGQLASRNPEWTLQIAGTGSDNAIATVKEMIRENKIEGRVDLLGQVSDMKTLYSHSGIFALSSRVEGMPMVLLEAMSQGCPCVAFDVGGASSEMMEDGGGIVVKDGSVDEYGKALDTLIRNDEEREEMSRAAVLSASHFSVDAFMQKWLLLINNSIRKS